jgi:hypothetical protein
VQTLLAADGLLLNNSSVSFFGGHGLEPPESASVPPSDERRPPSIIFRLARNSRQWGKLGSRFFNGTSEFFIA